MTINPYDAAAEQYEREVVPRYAPIADLVVCQALRGPAPASVVELCAGTGNLTRRLAPRLACASYVASDISEAMLEVAARTIDPNVDRLVADLRELPLPTASADLVVCSLGPVQDSDAGLAEVLRLLRPDGRLVVGMWGVEYAERRVLDGARRAAALEPYPPGDLQATIRRLERAGLVDVGLTEHRLPVVHQSVSAYLRYRASFGRLPGLTDAELDRYEAALAAEASGYADASGSVVLDWSIVVMEARRPGETSTVTPELELCTPGVR